MPRVFIDGKEGTTGLRIHERLARRADVTLVALPEAERKDPESRQCALNGCDVAILCLPDAAAVEAVAMIKNPDVRVIDASTAHRTASGWVYGFPELVNDGFTPLRTAKRVAVPGCHASGYVALVLPLVQAGLLKKDAQLSCTSVTGYSGGGKGMIAQYEDAARDPALASPRLYALPQAHKHLPEMRAYSGLDSAPAFCPVVADYACGMLTVVPVFAAQMASGASIEDIRDVYRSRYRGPVVRFLEAMDADGYVSAGGLAGLDAMDVTAAGNAERFVLLARFDNLGKGASGAAIQLMNIMIGADPYAGLNLGRK